MRRSIRSAIRISQSVVNNNNIIVVLIYYTCKKNKATLLIIITGGRLTDGFLRGPYTAIDRRVVGIVLSGMQKIVRHGERIPEIDLIISPILLRLLSTNLHLLGLSQQ